MVLSPSAGDVENETLDINAAVSSVCSRLFNAFINRSEFVAKLNGISLAVGNITKK
ncbi:hypothetical protein OH492_07665 [Vibrio chagasii]|nr:hypothetical protein [Vibrio chagasii]